MYPITRCFQKRRLQKRLVFYSVSGRPTVEVTISHSNISCNRPTECECIETCCNFSDESVSITGRITKCIYGTPYVRGESHSELF